jgi:hypothetical protein
MRSKYHQTNIDRKSLLSSKRTKTKYHDSMIPLMSASNSLTWGTAIPTAPEQKLIQQSNAAQNVLRTSHSSKTNSQKQGLRRIFRIWGGKVSRTLPPHLVGPVPCHHKSRFRSNLQPTIPQTPPPTTIDKKQNITNTQNTILPRS